MHRQCVWVLLFIIIGIFAQDPTVVHQSADSEDSSTCKPINKVPTICISVKDCPSVLQKILSEQNRESIRQLGCGFQGKTAKVCCETSDNRVPETTSKPLKSTPEIVQPAPQKERIEPFEHALLPDKTLCGVQVVRDHQTDQLHENATQILEFPWMAALYYTKDGDNERDFRCSGTLISKGYVLTAARCLFLEGYKLTGVRLGESKFSTTTECIRYSDAQEEECNDPVDIPISEKITHVYYDSATGANDIAMLRLEKKVAFSEYIRPICLPPKELSVPRLNTVLSASGWGLTESGTRSDIKLKLNVSVISDQECSKFSKGPPIGPCIQRAENLPFCNGESGGPLLKLFDRFDEDDIVQWYQEGIFYRGLGCRQAFGQYTRVSKYVNWIINNLKD